MAAFLHSHQKDVAECKMLKPALLCLLLLTASEVTIFNIKVGQAAAGATPLDREAPPRRTASDFRRPGRVGCGGNWPRESTDIAVKAGLQGSLAHSLSQAGGSLF